MLAGPTSEVKDLMCCCTMILDCCIVMNAAG